MTSPSIYYISRIFLSMFIVASLALPINMALAQESDQEKEYKAFQDIQAQGDAAKKSEMVLTFLRESPKSTYRPNVIAEYQRAIIELQKAERWSQIIASGDKFLDIVPDDEFTFGALAAAYAATNNTKGFAAFGEKAYASKPSVQLASAIAEAYRTLGNNAKFLQWGQRVLDSDPNNITILYHMTMQYMAAQNTAQAVKYAKMNLQALPKAKKPENVDEQTWKNTLDAMYAASYGTIGAAAFEQRSYAVAIKNLDEAVKYVKRNDSAYYHLGLAYWQTNKLDAAMLNFAKAYILKGSTSANARQYLEQLWKSSHRNSLVGMDKVIERAQQDLR